MRVPPNLRRAWTLALLAFPLSASPGAGADLLRSAPLPPLVEAAAYLQALAILGTFPESATRQIDLWGIGQIDLDALQSQNVTSLTLPGQPSLRVDRLASTGPGRWSVELFQGYGNLARVRGEVRGIFRLNPGSLEFIPLQGEGIVLYIRGFDAQVSSELSDYRDWWHIGWNYNFAEIDCSAQCPGTTTVQAAFYFSKAATTHAEMTYGGAQGWVQAQLVTVNKALKDSGTCVEIAGTVVKDDLVLIDGIDDANLLAAERYIRSVGKKGDLEIFVIVPKIASSFGGLAPVYPEIVKAQGIVDIAWGWFGLAHELGHLLGGRHEADTLDIPFKYGHGRLKGDSMTIVGSSVLVGSPFEYSHWDGTRWDNACVFRQIAPKLSVYYP